MASHKWEIAGGVAALFTVVGLIVAYKSYDSVPPQNFGVRITWGQLSKDILQPGYYWKSPILDSIYSFSNNTIIMEHTAGSGNNTKDQNPFTATMRLHYRIDPTVGILGMHYKALDIDGGVATLKDYMTQSVNAIVGSRVSRDHLANYDQFLQAFLDNLNWRIAQNNFPIRVDTVELLSAKIDLRTPVQLRLKPNGEVEDMAGPAAIAVPGTRLRTTPNP